MRGLGMLLVLVALLALPAAAHAGLWVGPAASYSWVNDLDFNNHNLIPAAAVGLEAGPLELVAKHPFDIQKSPNEWFKRGRYEVEAVVKFRF